MSENVEAPPPTRAEIETKPSQLSAGQLSRGCGGGVGSEVSPDGQSQCGESLCMEGADQTIGCRHDYYGSAIPLW